MFVQQQFYLQAAILASVHFETEQYFLHSQ
jgi:hypothetical protein